MNSNPTLTRGLGRDIRHAFRTLAAMPILATVVIVSLGIGIGVNTTVFSWIQGLVLTPLPGVKSAASLRLIEARTESGSHPGVSWAEFQDLRSNLTSFQEILAAQMVPFNVGAAGRIGLNPYLPFKYCATAPCSLLLSTRL